MLQFVIIGTVPSQKNSKQILVNRTTGRPFVASNPRVKAWQTDALWQLKAIKAPPWDYPWSIMMTFYWKDKRRHDLDNACAGVLDVLKKAEIIADDDYQHICPIHLDCGGVDKSNPRVEIQLTSISKRAV